MLLVRTMGLVQLINLANIHYIYWLIFAPRLLELCYIIPQDFSTLYNVCQLLLQTARFALAFVIIPLNLALLAYLHQQTKLLAFSHSEGGIPRRQQFSLILFLSQKLCNTYIAPMLVRYTIPILRVFSM